MTKIYKPRGLSVVAALGMSLAFQTTFAATPVAPVRHRCRHSLQQCRRKIAR